MDAKGKGLVEGLSPPFFEGVILSQEAKWVGFEPSVFQIMSFDSMLVLFGMDESFLEMLTCWHIDLSELFPAEMKAMTDKLRKIPVGFPPLPSPTAALGGTQRFEEFEMVVIRPSWRKKIPPRWFLHQFFVITELPQASFYFKKEPRWAQVRPCRKDGQALRGPNAFRIGLSWLHKSLRVSEDADSDQRRDQLLSFFLKQQTGAHHRLLVRGPTPALSNPDLPCGVGRNATATRRWR